MGVCKMDKGASVGQGFRQSSGKGRIISSFVPTGLQASTLEQSLISKIFLSLSKYCTVLIFATIHLGTIPANGNFTLQSTSYNWSSDLTVLAAAHVTNVSSGVWRLALLEDTVTYFQSGLAYYKDPVRMKDPDRGWSASFNTSFAVDKVIRDDHADGFALVISGDNTTAGGYGERLGIFDQYTGETDFKSIVVEFDGYLNTDINDINDNHVSFDFVSNNWTAAANASDVNVQVWDNQTLFAWVEYSNHTQQLEARVSNSNSRPITPLLNYTVDLFDKVDEYMWVGFSAGIGNPAIAAYFVRDWSFESYGIPPSTPTKHATKHATKLIRDVVISVGVLALLLACIFIVVIVQRMYGGRRGYKYCRLGWTSSGDEKELVELEGTLERFSYKQLSAATKNFSQESKLGEGGFGSVYQGVSPSGIPIAVKKISGDSSQGEKEFMAEVSIISRLRHRNLIQLTGWCKDAVKGYYLIVYELMPNGSLDKVLFGQAAERTACLSWPQRFNILTGTAAALEYLHQGWTQQVIHRDIKSSNIMLDERWNAKLGDFGLARLVDHDRAGDTVTLVAGTRGYIAPEVAISGKFTDKSDVYAFGAVMLELACGRKAFSPSLPEDEMFLVDWVWHRLSEGDLLSTVDERLESYDNYWMEVMLKIGLLCSHPSPLARPPMRHVLQILTGEAPMPSIPAFKPIVTYTEDYQSYFSDESHRQKIGSSSGSPSLSKLLVSTNFSESTSPPTSKFSGTSSNTNSSNQN